MDKIERIKVELQMITGVLTNDIDYLVYLVLRDGSYFSKEEDIVVRAVDPDVPKIECVESLDDWFDSLVKEDSKNDEGSKGKVPKSKRPRYPNNRHGHT